jgi:glycosyltransferase involved in cell wall biosynthesis
MGVIKSKNKNVYLSIILVNYNGSNFLDSCLSSIAQIVMEYDREIIIIDNCSTDNSVEIIAGNFSQ